jgi:hypothetical protein
MSSLADALDRDPPPGWRPEEGEKLVGVLVSVGMSNEGDYGSYPIAVVRREDGSEVAVHAFHEVLRSELQRAKPNIGDTVGIKYLGVPDGVTYNSYRVLVDRPAGATVDWSATEAASSTAPAPSPPSAVTAPTSAGAPTATAARPDGSPPPGDEDIPF